MRVIYSVLYVLLIIALVICAILTRRSDKPARDAVAFLEAALIPPVLGNLLIIATERRSVALTGCYLYYLGMDLVMYALINFTTVYCRERTDKRKHPVGVYAALAADAIQMMLNPVFGHAFDVKAVDVEGFDYYKLIPYAGQTAHRIIDYAVFICVLLIFCLKTVKSPKISRERYAVVLITMVIVGLIQTYNIFFQYAIDRSMLGYGVFGVVIYFFAIHYKPIRVLDRVLSNIVSQLSDAFYIFDPNGNCIWANEQGGRLVGIEDKNYDAITAKLTALFGEAGRQESRITKKMIGEGADTRFYLLEKNYVKDEKGTLDGAYLRIQDVTESELQLMARDKRIGQISMEAYRDSLTGVGSKAAYTRKVAELNSIPDNSLTGLAVAMIDMNNLKQINDDFGHKAGDLYIKGCCRLICEAFKHSPVFRIGGDEFVAVLQGQDYENRSEIAEKLRGRFAEAFAQQDLDPWLRYSAAVGVAEYTDEDNSFEQVFKRADQMMYEEKKQFKQKYGSYR